MKLDNGDVIGERLRKLRGDTSQREVADAIGVSTMAISSYESGKRIPADRVKIKLAEYYNVPIGALFFAE